MLEFLNSIDTKLFFFLNSLHHPILDPIMWFITKKESWFPFYVILLGIIIYKYKKQSIILIPCIALLILLADQISCRLFKDVFQRFRPSRVDEFKDIIHLLYGKRGGKFGFVSSHAANSFAAATFFSFLFRYKIFTYSIFSWAAIVSYTRVYSGVHYPGDIFCGAFLGIAIGIFVNKIRILVEHKYPNLK